MNRYGRGKENKITLRVFLIDDWRGVDNHLRTGLENLVAEEYGDAFRFDIRQAFNYRDAVTILKDPNWGNPHIFVVDQILSGRELGTEFLLMLDREERYKRFRETPKVILTGYYEVYDLSKARGLYLAELAKGQNHIDRTAKTILKYAMKEYYDRIKAAKEQEAEQRRLKKIEDDKVRTVLSNLYSATVDFGKNFRDLKNILYYVPWGRQVENHCEREFVPDEIKVHSYHLGYVLWKFGKVLGLNHETMVKAALLHDIGTSNADKTIVNAGRINQEKLVGEYFDNPSLHAEYGHDQLETYVLMPNLTTAVEREIRPLLKFVKWHHIWVNGEDELTVKYKSEGKVDTSARMARDEELLTFAVADTFSQLVTLKKIDPKAAVHLMTRMLADRKLDKKLLVRFALNPYSYLHDDMAMRVTLQDYKTFVRRLLIDGM